MKIAFITSFLVALCGARENPFLITSTNSSNAVTSQKNSYKPPLTSRIYNIPSSARVLKEATFTFQNLDGSLETRRIEIEHSVDWRTPLVLSQGSLKKNEALIAPVATMDVSKLDFISFKLSRNNLFIQTKDPMLRSFTLSDPSSVIVDFRHNGLFDTAHMKFNAVPFVGTKVTNHGKLARVTIVLDGNHECKTLKEANGVNVVCK